MNWITMMEQVSRLMHSAEALGPHLRPYWHALDRARFARWLPFAPVTPWPLLGTAFGAGLALGAAGGLLLAPKSGRELRHDLRQQLGSKMGSLARQTRRVAERTHVINLFKRGKSDGASIEEVQTVPGPEGMVT